MRGYVKSLKLNDIRYEYVSISREVIKKYDFWQRLFSLKVVAIVGTAKLPMTYNNF
jgi:hypothetical protein